MTELAAPQISSLMEALPGIAAVLRSPVANAMVAVSRASAGLEEFQLTQAEELLRYGVRRNLLTQEEVDKVLDELRVVAASRPQRPTPVPEKPKKPVPAAPAKLEMRGAAHHGKPAIARPMAAKPVPKPIPPRPAAKTAGKPAAPAHAAPKRAVAAKAAPMRKPAAKAAPKRPAPKAVVKAKAPAKHPAAKHVKKGGTRKR